MAISSDRYELFEPIGQNDYLTVYRGWDRRLKRFVAVMELNQRYRANQQHYERIWDEVLASARIEHYALVRVYEVDKQHGWIITQLMRGSVAAKIAEAGLSSKQVRSILRTGLDALAYLHERGKLHGDVRPSNLLIDDEGHVRLSHPIGLAIGGQIPERKLNQKYLAPELVKPELFGEPSPSTDLYCLGFTAYELLVGPGFDSRLAGVKDLGGTGSTLAVGWWRWHSSEETQLPALGEVVPGVAQDVAEVIGRLISKRVSDRPASALDALGCLGETELEEAIFAAAVAGPQRHANELAGSKGSTLSNLGDSPVVQNARRSAREATSSREHSATRLTPSTAKPGPALGRMLENPWIFRSVAAVVLVLAALIGIALQPKENKSAGDAHAASTRTDPQVTSPTSNATISSDLHDLKNEINRLMQISEMNKSSMELLNRFLAQIDRWITAHGSSATGEAPSIPVENPGIDALRLSIDDLKATFEEGDNRQRDLIAALGQLNDRLHVVLKPPLESTPDDPSNDLESTEAQEYSKGAQQKLLENDFDGAIADFVQARGLAPADGALWRDGIINAYVKRGWRRMDLQQYEAAVADFDRAVVVAQEQFGQSIPTQFARTAIFGRGAAHLASGSQEMALVDFTHVLHVLPDSANAYIKRGITLAQLERYEEARHDFDKAVSLNSRSYSAFNNRGACLIRLQNFADAINDFDVAVSIDDSIPDAFFNRHIAYRNIGDVEKARRDLARARQIDPSIELVPEKPIPSEPADDKPSTTERSPLTSI